MKVVIVGGVAGGAEKPVGDSAGEIMNELEIM